MNNCPHVKLEYTSQLYAMETREQPAEYIERWSCTECGAELDGPNEDESESESEDDDEE